MPSSSRGLGHIPFTDVTGIRIPLRVFFHFMCHTIGMHKIFFSKRIHFYSQKIGMAGFEPATFCSQSRHATKLRYIPSIIISKILIEKRSSRQ